MLEPSSVEILTLVCVIQNAVCQTRCGDGSSLYLFHYEVGYNGTDWGTHRTSKDLFVMGVVVFEAVVIETNPNSVMMLLFLCSTMTPRSPAMSTKKTMKAQTPAATSG